MVYIDDREILPDSGAASPLSGQSNKTNSDSHSQTVFDNESFGSKAAWQSLPIASNSTGEPLNNPTKSRETQETIAAFIKKFSNSGSNVILGKKNIIGLASELKNIFDGNISIENLKAIGSWLGVTRVVKSPIVEVHGGKGLTIDPTNGGGTIIYHAILPGNARFVLAHEIGHIILGHFKEDINRSLKKGLRQEWDADTFAVALTGTPRTIALIYNHTLDGLLGKIYKIAAPWIKKNEAKRFIKEFGEIPPDLKDLF